VSLETFPIRHGVVLKRPVDGQKEHGVSNSALSTPVVSAGSGVASQGLNRRRAALRQDCQVLFFPFDFAMWRASQLVVELVGEVPGGTTE